MIDRRGGKGKLVAGGPVLVEGERVAAEPLQRAHALDRLETIALIILGGVIRKDRNPLRGKIPLG